MNKGNEDVDKYVRPDNVKDEEYIDQVIVNSSTNGETVTGHVIMTRGKWWIQGLGTILFCMECPKAPKGLPISDETTPIGSKFKR